MFCLNYFALNKPVINTVLLLVSSRVTFNQQFCRWRCFSFYWFGKWEFGKFRNGIPIIPPPLFELFIKHHWLKLKGSSPNVASKFRFENIWNILERAEINKKEENTRNLPYSFFFYTCKITPSWMFSW